MTLWKHNTHQNQGHYINTLNTKKGKYNVEINKVQRIVWTISQFKTKLTRVMEIYGFIHSTCACVALWVAI